jgi:hypothetical protein
MTFVEHLRRLAAAGHGSSAGRLYGWLAAGYGWRSWCLTVALILGVCIATSMLTTTPERPSAPRHTCSESWWEGSGRDGTPCP